MSKGLNSLLVSWLGLKIGVNSKLIVKVEISDVKVLQTCQGGVGK